jgi:hypothetical protein
VISKIVTKYHAMIVVNNLPEEIIIIATWLQFMREKNKIKTVGIIYAKFVRNVSAGLRGDHY